MFFTFPRFTKPCFSASLSASCSSPSICTVHRFENSKALKLKIADEKMLQTKRIVKCITVSLRSSSEMNFSFLWIVLYLQDVKKKEGGYKASPNARPRPWGEIRPAIAHPRERGFFLKISHVLHARVINIVTRKRNIFLVRAHVIARDSSRTCAHAPTSASVFDLVN